MTDVTFKSPVAVPHKYRNRFLRDAGGSTVISGGSSGSSVDLSSYLKRTDADQRFLRGPLAINAGLTFDDFFEKDVINEETGEWVIKAKKSLYSVGGLTSYGYGNEEEKLIYNKLQVNEFSLGDDTSILTKMYADDDYVYLTINGTELKLQIVK